MYLISHFLAGKFFSHDLVSKLITERSLISFQAVRCGMYIMNPFFVTVIYWVFGSYISNGCRWVDIWFKSAAGYFHLIAICRYRAVFRYSRVVDYIKSRCCAWFLSCWPVSSNSPLSPSGIALRFALLNSLILHRTLQPTLWLVIRLCFWMLPIYLLCLSPQLVQRHLP